MLCSAQSRSCLILCDPMDYSPRGSFLHGDFPGKNTVVCFHFLLQRIILTQGLNLSPAWQADSIPLRHWGSPLAAYLTPNCFLFLPNIANISSRDTSHTQCVKCMTSLQHERWAQIALSHSQSLSLSHSNQFNSGKRQMTQLK